MWAAVALVLCVDPIWVEPLGSGRDRAEVVPALGSQIREELDELERALKQWERERREQLDEQRLERERLSRNERDEAPPPTGSQKNKVIEVGKGGRARGKAKVIELPQRGKVDQQIDELAAESAARRERCQKDPAACAREKKQQQELARGNEAWDQAAAAAEEKRRSELEAEAKKLQEGLDAAKQRADAGY